ncbi:MAG: hypothetical protein NTV87_00095 [Ignavibacteriae bacterium]|nr:hypothetical protein [Ignavibacteriota bacterium]
MSIWIFDGTPGSGKSQAAVEKVIANLKSGRKVYSNIDGHDDPVCLEGLRAMSGLSDLQFKEKFEFIKPEKSRQFYRYVDKGSLIVIDEAHKYFNVRKWADKENNDFFEWASTHRHFGFELLLITIKLSRIDTSVRELAEWTVRYKKTNYFGKRFFQKKYTEKWFSQDDTGSKPLKTNIKTYDERLWKCYQSYVAKDIKEAGLMEHINVLKHPAVLAIPVLICVFFLLLWHSSLRKGTEGFSKYLGSVEAKQTDISKLPVINNDGTVKMPEIAKVEEKKSIEVKNDNIAPGSGVGFPGVKTESGGKGVKKGGKVDRSGHTAAGDIGSRWSEISEDEKSYGVIDGKIIMKENGVYVVKK